MVARESGRRRGTKADLTQSLVISIDAMGGDHGPPVVVAACDKALAGLGDARLLLHGDEALIRPELARHKALAARCEVRHTDRIIAMDEKPAQAMRRGKGTSMW